jgi:hypothetical protein
MRTLCKLVLGLALVACDGASGGSLSIGVGDPAAGGDAGAGSTCPGLNLTQACQCGPSPGSQGCLATGWGPCQCNGVTDDGTVPGQMSSDAPTGTVPAGNLRNDLKFSWSRTPASAGSCEPGFYVGSFMGLYFPSATFGLAPLPVVSSGTAARPGLAFTLEESGSGEHLEITDGWMEGTANSTFPFEAAITGTLNCTTLQFDAVMDGGYWTSPDMSSGRVNFIGPIVGIYDKPTHTIQMGTWDLDEYNPAPAIPSGGNGTWQAGWQP